MSIPACTRDDLAILVADVLRGLTSNHEDYLGQVYIVVHRAVESKAHLHDPIAYARTVARREYWRVRGKEHKSRWSHVTPETADA